MSSLMGCFFFYALKPFYSQIAKKIVAIVSNKLSDNIIKFDLIYFCFSSWDLTFRQTYCDLRN